MSVYISATTGRSNKHLTADAFQNNGQRCSVRYMLLHRLTRENAVYTVQSQVLREAFRGRLVTVILAKSGVFTRERMKQLDSSCSETCSLPHINLKTEPNFHIEHKQNSQ